MGNPVKASASVLAAAVVAILAAVLTLLSCSFAFFGILLFPLPAGTAALPPGLRTATLVILAIMVAVSVFGIVTGVGLILLRNWARISALVWGGLCVCFGGIGIPFAFLLPNFSPLNTPGLPEGTEQLIKWMLVFLYGLPLVAGVWWLILFNRKSVKAQFAGAGALADAALAQKPRRPLPVTVLAWFYLTSILNLVFLPFMPLHVPIFVFGIALPAGAGLAVLLLTALGFFAGGVGILKLKPWSYSLTIGLQMFWMASTAVSLLSPNYQGAIAAFWKDMQARTYLPETQFSPEPFAHLFGWIMKFGFVFAGVILGILVYYRPRFLAAASAAKALSNHRVSS
jgi:hypothetical protein